MSIFKNGCFLAAALLISTTTQAGSVSPMSKDEVKNTFSDKTVTTITAATLDGTVISDSFTGYFSKDGKATGKFATKPDNEPQNDTGTWKVNEDGKFCFKWDHWDKGNEECVNIYKLSNAYLIVNSEGGFESLIMNKDIKSGNQQ